MDQCMHRQTDRQIDGKDVKGTIFIIQVPNMLPCHLILRLLFRCESWTQCEHMWRMCVSTASMLCEILLSTYRQYTDVSTRVLQSVYVSFSSTTGVNTHVYFSMNSMHALKTHEILFILYEYYYIQKVRYTRSTAEIFDRRTRRIHLSLHIAPLNG